MFSISNPRAAVPPPLFRLLLAVLGLGLPLLCAGCDGTGNNSEDGHNQTKPFGSTYVSVAGRVEAADGAPVSEVAMTVTAFEYEDAEGCGTEITFESEPESDRTDDQGRYNALIEFFGGGPRAVTCVEVGVIMSNGGEPDTVRFRQATDVTPLPNPPYEGIGFDVVLP